MSAIPHIVHYCWFGTKQKPSKVEKYINTWKRLLPDYKFIEWNENNFPVDFCEYSKEAYVSGKYAFVSDVARLYALQQMGGIYFDTDIELLKPLPEFDADYVFSFESRKMLMTGFMAGIKGGEIWMNLLQDYKCRHFIDSEGHFDLRPNTFFLSKEILKYGLSQNGCEQVIDNGSIHVFNNVQFGAFDTYDSKWNISSETVLVHRCLGSWESPLHKLLAYTRRGLRKAAPKAYDFVREFKDKSRRGI